MVLQGSSKQSHWVAHSAAGFGAFLVAHVLWGAAAIAFGLVGFRFASSTSSPSLVAVANQQWRDLILPFLPAAAAGGLALGLARPYLRSRGLAAAAGALAAPIAFLLTLVVAGAVRPRTGGYAAEQGMAVLGCFIAPIIGLSASPLWALAAFFLRPTQLKAP